MNGIPLERLVDGMVNTLMQHVLPEVEGRFARGQLFAVMEVLANLRDRVEPKQSLFTAECTSAVQALEETATVLEGSAVDIAQTIRERIQAAPTDSPRVRTAALRQALVDALTKVEGLPRAQEARAPLLRHLAAQNQRELDVLSESLVYKVLKG